MPFEAGAIESTLTVDRDPWNAGLAQARKEAKAFASERWKTTLDADPKALDTALRKARSDLSGFGREKYEASLGVRFDSAGLRAANVELDQAARKRRDISLRAVLDGGSKVNGELAALEASASRLDGRTINMRVVLDGAPLAIAEAQAVDMAMDRLDGRNVSMNVDLDGAAGLAAQLEAIEAARARTDGQSVRINADGSQLDGLILKLGLVATAASAAGIAGAGALLGVGAGATAALPGLGALALGFGGVSEAVKATTDQQAKAGAQAGKTASQVASSADAQRNAAASLQNAERSLATARENARDGAIQAARAVTRARQQAADQVAAAIERERSAETTATRAWRDAARAREEINDALKTAKQRMEDLQFQVLGGALQERRAVLNLQKAQEELNAARAAGVGGREMAELVLSYDEARLAVDQTAASNRRLTAEKAESDRRGIAGSKEVQAATERATDATDRAREADRQVAQARAAVTKAQVDGAARVQEAVEAQARQQRQAAQSIAAAEAARESALRQVEAAQRKATEATSGGSAAIDKAKEAMDKLSPTAQNFVRFLVGLEPKWRNLQRTAQEGLLPGVQSGIEALLTREPEINAFVGKYSKAMGDLAQRTGQGLASEKWTSWFNWLGDQASPTIQRFGDITGNSLGGLAQLMKAASPLWYELGDAIVRGTSAFERWATVAASGGSEGFNRFMQEVRTYGPVVWDTIVKIAEGGWHLAESLAPIGGALLKVTGGIADFIAAAPPGVLQSIAVAVLGIAGAWKTVKIAESIGRGISAVGTLASGIRTALTPSLLAATGPMQALGDKSSTLAQKVGVSEERATRFGGAMSKVGGALPLIGVALIGVGIAYDQLRDRSTDAAKSVIDGSASMQQAIDEEAAAIGRSSAFWDINAKTLQETQVEARQKVMAEIDKQIAQMGPLEAATARVNVNQAKLSDAIKLYGDRSPQARDAQQQLTNAQRDADTVQRSLRDHVDLTTAAIRNQQDQNLAAVDANLAKRQADLQLKDAQDQLNTAIREHGAGSREAESAQVALEQAQSRAADAAMRSAGGQKAYNDTVAAMVRDTKGPLNETLSGLVAGMDAAGLSALGAKFRIDDTGRAVVDLPGGKTVVLNADTAPALTGIAGVAFAMQSIPPGKTITVNTLDEVAQQRLRDIGFTVTAIPGTKDVQVTANDAQARTTLLAFQMYGDAVKANPQIAADPRLSYETMQRFLADAGRQTGVPALDANPQRADQQVRDAVDRYNRSWSTMPVDAATAEADRKAREAHDRANAPAQFGVGADTQQADKDTRSWWQRWTDWFFYNPFDIFTRFTGGDPPAPAPGRAEGGPVGYASGGRVWRRYPTGGRISGPGTGTSDDVPIMASNGEYVVRASSVRQPGVRPLLDHVNAMASGGVVGRYAAGGGIAAASATTAAPAAAGAGASGAAASVDIDPTAAADAAASTDGLAGSMVGAANAAGLLNPMLQALAATQTGILVPAQDLVTAGQQTLVTAGIDPLVSTMTGTLAPALAGYGQQVGVDAPAANTALQGAQTLTQMSTTATAANTAANAGAMTAATQGTSAAQQFEHGMIRTAQGLTQQSTNLTAQNTAVNAGAMTGAVVGTSLAQQYEHGMIRTTQGLTMGQQTALAQNTGVNTAAQTFATQATSAAQQFEHGNIRASQGLTMGQQNALALNTAQNTGNMSFTTGQMSGTVQGHLGSVRGAQGTTTQATTGFADSWRTQLGRTAPDSANPLRYVINTPLSGVVGAWNTIDQQFALGKHVNPPVANFATGGQITGPGTGTSDSVPIMASAGEFMVREKIAHRVSPFLSALNRGQAEALQAAGAGRPAPRGYAGGGIIGAQAFGARESGKPYIWGGVGPAGYDCSGFVSALISVARGHPIRRFGQARNAGSWPGMRPGLGGAFSVGSSFEHMAATIGGVNAESGGRHNNVAFGGPAVGADNGQFPVKSFLPEFGGAFKSGGPGDGGGGGFFDFGQIVRDAFAFVYDQIAQVPKLFGGSDQVARAAGIPKAGADMAIDSLINKLSSLFSFGGGGGVPDTALANLIVGVGKAMGFPRKGPEIALATALQESGLHNIAHGDRDSLGVFQQRPSQGWGTPAQIMDPRYSSMKFYNALRGVRGWEGMPHTVAAQAVQRSAFPDAYAKWVGQAISLVNNSRMYDNGGPLPDDAIAINRSGEVETVLSTDQGRALRDRLDVDDRLGALVGGRGVVTGGGDGANLLVALEAMTQRIEKAVATMAPVNVYPQPGQSEESIGEAAARRSVQARRTALI